MRERVCVGGRVTFRDLLIGADPMGCSCDPIRTHVNRHHTHFHHEADVVKDVHALNGNLAAIAVNCTADEIEVAFFLDLGLI